MAECYFTPHKGTCSCRGCQYSSDPKYYDPGCKLPKEVWEKAVRGEEPPFPVMTEQKEVTYTDE